MSRSLGVRLIEGGAEFAVYSENADAVAVCVVGADGTETRTDLGDRTGHVFHGFVRGVEPGTRYGLRVTGPSDPASGLRFDDSKLLLDPYATATTDASDGTILGVVTDPRSFDWGDDAPPRTPLADTVVYELHVKGFTKTMPGVPEELRGTYAGLAHGAAIDYLRDLGVTAVELMPVHRFVQDGHLLEKGLRNYWGYNSLAFLAPHPEYAAADDPLAQVDEFKTMVAALHAAGIEVILDVVYNHTAEGNHDGPTLSLKGIDNPSYYRLVEGDPEHYFDTTGTGNSLNVGHPAALALIMDSLRYWVTEMHVDGFRFDLATTLTRQGGDPDVHSAFLALTHQDPTLAPVKLIAEPWDTAGYQVGGFPADWSEWNGRYRDDVRDFWRGRPGILGTFSQRVLGSPDVYEASRRSPLSSVNFVTAHDGFTLADLTSYDEKHNEANGEGGADGESDNRSSGYGAEGPTDDEGINRLRTRQRKNFLATLLLSAGVPMLLGGDERGRTQGGNNNAYCQDNETSWFDWEHGDDELLDLTRRLIALRRAEPALQPDWYREAPGTGILRSVDLRRADGRRFVASDWLRAEHRAIVFILGHAGHDAFAVLMNAAENGVEFSLPRPPHHAWRLELTSDEGLAVEVARRLTLAPRSFAVLRSTRSLR
ncbi:glycogen debranching enzyme GlgX [Gryllotalpicola protaetiae]|uniref:Glycogen debranching enzyme GlgX n=1 Tax=Gryllotalpicola protaetiae TaxID=2419771 RepID=A0A387BNS5_9MICO|nr:glycogen debranching protein GlgX [Gryllotalpicola protaetiae]AYG05463.1 glycogen debranching enzyme GlgX [Gryllotalpicola protaetiae]